jgi:uncharacterized protein (TIGR03083 family)
MRPAARLLLVEAEALPPILDAAPPEHFDRPTVCDGWSVRDVLAHCGAALTHCAHGTVHRFTPDDNESDVVARRSWPLAEVIAELLEGYRTAAAVIDGAAGQLDGIGLGEWMHGGDVRESLDAPDPYTSPGAELALELLLERSSLQKKLSIIARIDGELHQFGTDRDPVGRLVADLETFVRLCGGRRPDPARFDLTGADVSDLVLFG